MYGAPCSGKTSYVMQVATRYDLIVDLDKIHQAICICDIFDKPDATKKLAYDIRDLLLDVIKVRKVSGKCICYWNLSETKRARKINNRTWRRANLY